MRERTRTQFVLALQLAALAATLVFSVATSTMPTCTTDADCPPGEACRANYCQPGGVPPMTTRCGDNTCLSGEFCCNPSCGICAPEGGVCTQEICNPACSSDADCDPGRACLDGYCFEGERCGDNFCSAGSQCCNALEGICVMPGEVCAQ